MAETPFGILQYRPDEPVVGAAIASRGECLPASAYRALQLLAPGAWVFEAGAGVGACSLFLARHLGERGHLIAWEPRAVFRRILRQNLSANRLGNATVLDDLPAIDALGLERLEGLVVGPGPDDPTWVAGAAETLWRFRPIVIGLSADAPARSVLAACLKDLGYRCWHERAGTTPGSGPESPAVENVLTLLGIPEERDVNLDADGWTPFGTRG